MLTNRRSEAVIQPFTTDAATGDVYSGILVSNYAPDMLLETAPRSRKILRRLFRMEQTSPSLRSPQFSAPIDMSGPRNEKQRISRGVRVSLHKSPELLITGVSAAVAPLPIVGGSASEARNNDPDLRREFEHLRREFERMRQVQEMAQEAPPLYKDEARVDA